MTYHTLTWLAWLCAAAFAALVNSQPLQTVLLILTVGTVFTVASKASTGGESSGAGRHTAAGWGTFLRLGLWVWAVATIFNLLFAHAGRVILFTLPRNWPLIGGPITLEALLYGLSNGASLFAVLLVFATFNLALDSHRLLRWLPSGLFQAGLVVSIALSFIPQLMSSFQEIREAQRVRGHQFRGLRDWIPLFVPLITTALERSLTLAESMEARGFGGIAPQSSEAGRTASSRSLATPLTIVGLVALLTGLLMRAIVSQALTVTTILLFGGTIALLAALYVQGRGFQRSHYRFEAWRPGDTYVAALSLASLVALGLIQWRAPSLLYYYPYPPSSPWPGFSPWVGLATSLLAAPILWWQRDTRQPNRLAPDHVEQVPQGLP
ncbi:MAG TPA: energy-coupling factor transporter transmembrane component T [Anaerolineae bacterium]|nr:energy-coupling factor transporter transmembrane component T [Anaerolineae bacterium]HQJ50814.1 energy-coupling factor transporter transmembrane component T [Anaerolineae bacterium]